MVFLLAVVLFAHCADVRAQRRSGAAWAQATCDKKATIGDLEWELSGEKLTVTIGPNAQAIPDIPDNVVFEMEQDCRGSVTNLVLSQIKNIGAHAFDSFPNLKDVTVGEDCLVGLIGDFAFANTMVLDLKWPNLATVGTSAFEGCKKLVLFDAPKLATIGDRAFAGTSLQSFSWTKVQSVGIEAFVGSAMTSFSSDISLKKIGARAFAGTGMNTVSFPVSPEIGEEAFCNCSSLKILKLSGSIMGTIGARAFVGCGSLSRIEIAGVSSIGASAFEGLTELTDASFDNTLSQIGESAFRGCGLSTVDLRLVEGISDWAFAECKALKTVTFNTALKNIGTGAFMGCAFAELNLENAYGVSIGARAFEGCLSLANCKLPSSLTVVPEKMFNGCVLLETVECQPLVEIGASAFESCSKLTRFQFTEKLTTIQQQAFYRSGLVDVDLTKSVSLTLQTSAFGACSSLSSLTLPDVVTALPAQLVSECAQLVTFVVPPAVTTIGDGCFNKCTSLVNVTYLGNSVFRNSFFEGCSSLSTVTVKCDYASNKFGTWTKLTRLPCPSTPTPTPTEEVIEVTFNHTEATKEELTVSQSCELVLNCNGDCGDERIEVNNFEVVSGAQVTSDFLSLGSSLVMSGSSSMAASSKGAEIQFREDNVCEIEMTASESGIPSINLGRAATPNKPKSLSIVLSAGFDSNPDKDNVLVEGYGFGCDVWQSKTSVNTDASQYEWKLKCERPGPVLFATPLAYEQLILRRADPRKQLSAAQIAGICIGALVLLTVVVVGSVILFDKKRRETTSSSFSAPVSM